MTLSVAAKEQMAELAAHRTAAQKANLEADTADKLDDLRLFDHCFTSWERAGQVVPRNGYVVKFDSDARTVNLLEIVPDGYEPCDACGRIPAPQRTQTRMFTVHYTDITEIHRYEWAGRTGLALKMLGAVLDGRNVSDPRPRQLLAWALDLGKNAA